MNDKQLPWKYPRGFWCKKCHNTGYKLKNGKSCKDCWGKFAHQANVQQIPNMGPSGFRIPFTPLIISDPYKPRPAYISVQSYPLQVPYQHLNQSSPPQQQNQYQPQYEYGYEQQQQSAHPPSPPPRPDSEKSSETLPNEPPPPYTATDTATKPPPSRPPPLHPTQSYPQPMPVQNLGPRVVRPGDPSMGGILCGRCRGTGITHDFFLDEEYCKVCKGAGRVFR